MTSSSLFRWGGVSAVIGGGLMGLDVFLHLFADDTLTPAELGGLAHETAESLSRSAREVRVP